MTQHSSFSTHHWDFVWGTQYIDEAVCMDIDTDGDGFCADEGGSKRYFYCQDANWNVIALREGSTITERYEYDPYGEPRVLKGYTSAEGQEDLTVTGDSVAGNPIRFGGYYFDEERSAYLVRHRVYLPWVARWGQKEPLGYVDGMNRHAYLMGRPTATTDPMGLWQEDLHLVRTRVAALGAGMSPECADVIANADWDVDQSTDAASFPQYHFDFDKDALTGQVRAYSPGRADWYHKRWYDGLLKLNSCDACKNKAVVLDALKLIGQSMHHYQDGFSHKDGGGPSTKDNQGHMAGTPLDHAPFWLCLLRDPLGISPTCRELRNSPNWLDHERPDKREHFRLDWLMTVTGTRYHMDQLMGLPSIKCWCKQKGS